MDTMQIKYFLEAATCLNFTKVADKFFVTQSCISKQIALLEQELEVTLFLRKQNKLQLTQAGSILYDEFFKISQSFQKAVQKAKRTAAGEMGSLSIGITQYSATTEYVTYLLAQLSDRYPHMDVTAEKDSLIYTMDGLSGDHYDCVLTTDSSLESFKELDFIPISKQEYHIILPHTHRLFGQKKVCLSDLAKERFVTFYTENFKGGHHQFVNLCKHYDFVPEIGKVVPTLESFFLYIEMGSLLSLLPIETPAFDNPKLRFIKIEEDYPEKYLTIGLAYKKNIQNPSIPLLIKTIKAIHHCTEKMD